MVWSALDLIMFSPVCDYVIATENINQGIVIVCSILVNSGHMCLRQNFSASVKWQLQYNPVHTCNGALIPPGIYN